MYTKKGSTPAQFAGTCKGALTLARVGGLAISLASAACSVPKFDGTSDGGEGGEGAAGAGGDAGSDGGGVGGSGGKGGSGGLGAMGGQKGGTGGEGGTGGRGGNPSGGSAGMGGAGGVGASGSGGSGATSGDGGDGGSGGSSGSGGEGASGGDGGLGGSSGSGGDSGSGARGGSGGDAGSAGSSGSSGAGGSDCQGSSFTKIYFAEQGLDDGADGKISLVDLDGLNLDVVVSGLSDPYGFTLGASGLYFCDGGSPDVVGRTDRDGSNKTTLIGAPLTPTTIKLDEASDMMYWAESLSTTDPVRRANLDGSNPSTVGDAAAGRPWGVALDLEGGKIYWTDTNANRIRRSNLDGTSPEIVVTTGVSAPAELELDLEHDGIFWAEFHVSAGKIMRANLDGTSVQTLVSNLASPTGLAVDTGACKLYWATRGSNVLQSSDLAGQNVQTLVTGLSGARAVELGED